jgi:hypothetical protein
VVQQSNRELNGGARDACKIMAATPRTAMVGKAVKSTDQMPVSILLFKSFYILRSHIYLAVYPNYVASRAFTGSTAADSTDAGNPNGWIF